jgi:uncharacterized protein (DUF697 family)
MHDIDRTLAELSNEADELATEQYESAYESDSEYYGETDNESPFNEVDEMELASQLLGASSEAELDQFLGSLFKKVGRTVGSVVKSPIGQALGGILKKVAKTALPIAGSALGGMVGGPLGASLGGNLGSMATKLFELELEGMSLEDQEFEVARRVVRLAGAAARNAAVSAPNRPPMVIANYAVTSAARRYAPGLVAARRPGRPGYPPVYPQPAPGPYPYTGGRSGRWVRRGRNLILFGV